MKIEVLLIDDCPNWIEAGSPAAFRKPSQLSSRERDSKSSVKGILNDP